MVFVRAIGWDVPGLALGHAGSYVFATAVGLALLRSKLGSLDGRAHRAHTWRGGSSGGRHGARRVARSRGESREVVEPSRSSGGRAGGDRRSLAGVGVYLGAALMLRSKRSMTSWARCAGGSADESYGRDIGCAGQDGMIGKVGGDLALARRPASCVAGLDAVSIARTTFTPLRGRVRGRERRGGDGLPQRRAQRRQGVCGVAATVVETIAPALKLGRNGCRVDGETGRVTRDHSKDDRRHDPRRSVRADRGRTPRSS